MEKYIGKSVYKGTAIGPINVLKKSDGIVKRQHVEDVAAELQRLEDAKKQAQAQLGALYEKALQEVGEVNAQIFEVHQMMLEDEDYQDAIHSMIETEELNAEYAVAVTRSCCSPARISPVLIIWFCDCNRLASCFGSMPIPTSLLVEIKILTTSVCVPNRATFITPSAVTTCVLIRSAQLRISSYV